MPANFQEISAQSNANLGRKLVRIHQEPLENLLPVVKAFRGAAWAQSEVPGGCDPKSMIKPTKGQAHGWPGLPLNIGQITLYSGPHPGSSPQGLVMGPTMPQALTLTLGWVLKLPSPEAWPPQILQIGYPSYTPELRLSPRRKPCWELPKTLKAGEICWPPQATPTFSTPQGQKPRT